MMLQHHTVVRRALARVVMAHPGWRAEPLVLLRNRLLDECGGDARALISLLVRAAELGITDRIVEWDGNGLPWPALRGSLVVTLVSDAFLRPEMATWAIDTWGAALHGSERLGIVDVPSTPTRGDVARTGARGDDTPRASGADVGRPAPPVAPLPSAARARTAPSRTGVARPPGTNAPGASRAPVRPPAGTPNVASVAQPGAPSIWPSAPGAGWHSMTRVALAVIVLGLAYLVVQVTGAARRREAARQSQPAPAPAAPAAPVAIAAGPAMRSGEAPARIDSPSPSLSGLARGALPAEANEASRLLRVQPPTRARGIVGPGAAVLESQVALLATTRADRVILRSGRTLTGRVEVVRASVVVFRDAESGLRYEFAKREIREITTEFGTTVRFGNEGDPENERRSPLVVRGLAGSYRVTYGFQRVQGSAECQATPTEGLAPDVMTIEHIPDTDTLTLVLRSGSRYYGVVDADGLFATALAIQGDQAMEASAYTSRLNGRFTERGFEGTANLIAYRKVRGGRDIVCHTTLTATGERLTPSAPIRRRP